MQDFFLGAMDDMAAWTTNGWRNTITMLDKGTRYCSIISINHIGPIPFHVFTIFSIVENVNSTLSDIKVGETPRSGGSRISKGGKKRGGGGRGLMWNFQINAFWAEFYTLKKVEFWTKRWKKRH